MFFIMTIMFSIISLIIAGIAYGIQYALESPNMDFWFTWLYSFVGWLTFFVLFVSYANCTGKRRFRNLKSYLEKNQYEGGEIELEANANVLHKNKNK